MVTLRRIVGFSLIEKKGRPKEVILSVYIGKG
jgi:hypothetical protein